jgi:hypothetical protein
MPKRVPRDMSHMITVQASISVRGVGSTKMAKLSGDGLTGHTPAPRGGATCHNNTHTTSRRAHTHVACSSFGTSQAYEHESSSPAQGLPVRNFTSRHAKIPHLPRACSSSLSSSRLFLFSCTCSYPTRRQSHSRQLHGRYQLHCYCGAHAVTERRQSQRSSQ